MSISRWNPWGDMMSLRDAMDELLRESFVLPRPGTASGGFGVALDVRETNDDYVVKAVLPGVKPNEVHVQVKGDTLTISGETKEEEEQGPGQQQPGQQGQSQSQGQTQQTQSQQTQAHGQQGQQPGQQAQRGQWLVRERRFGRFQRTVTLPTPVQADQAKANFEHGVLTITLPKSQEARARSIPIQAGQGQGQTPAIEAQGQVHGQQSQQGQQGQVHS
ncbi:MAG TPA: Hsp20/alpha crystallin family protein [Nitrolancea sp.]|nr:Hsp20/alpha crystallin family protein [Nitrolancea sp.]